MASVPAAPGHVSGYSEAHRALEEALADWLGYPRALLFISGFAANQALIAALVEKDDRIVADRLSHASPAGGGKPQPGAAAPLYPQRSAAARATAG